MTTCAPGFDKFLCHDCSRCTCTRHLREYYMLSQLVWRRIAWPLLRVMYCIRCAETRLGRPLIRADFVDVPLNTQTDIPRSPLLRMRLGSGPAPLAPAPG